MDDALKEKRLFYISISSAHAKVRSLYKLLFSGRRCIVICHDGERAQKVAAALNDTHVVYESKGPVAVFVNDSSAIAGTVRCAVVSASGMALTPEEAEGFDTFVMHDNPTNKKQFRNWVCHSPCPDVALFLVDEPADQNALDNALMDAVEDAFAVRFHDLRPDRSAKKSSRGDKDKPSRHKTKDKELASRLEDTERLLAQLVAQQQQQAQQAHQRELEEKAALEQQVRTLQLLLQQQQQPPAVVPPFPAPGQLPPGFGFPPQPQFPFPAGAFGQPPQFQPGALGSPPNAGRGRGRRTAPPQNGGHNLPLPPAAHPVAVQQLANVDQELERLRLELATRLGGPPAPQAGAGAEEVPRGVWIPGKGYQKGGGDGPKGKGGGGGGGGYKGKGGGGGKGRGAPAPPAPNPTDDEDGPKPEEWRTTEQWDDNALSY